MAAFIAIFNVVMFWVFLGLLIWYAYILFINKGIPNVPTVKVIRKKTLEIIRSDYEKRGSPHGYNVLDMGSGNGTFALMIAKEFPNMRVIGIEIAPIAYVVSRIICRLCGKDNINIIRQDFMTYDTTQADVVVLYLTSHHMISMGEKLKKELKPGALIISNAFVFSDPSWIPVEENQIKTKVPLQGRLTVYRR